MPETIEIPVVTRLQDNGDGGYTMRIYNTEDELIADHPKSKKWDSEAKTYVKVELTEEERLEILDEHDPYENGYMGSNTITVEVNEDGTYKLAKSLSFSAGQ